MKCKCGHERVDHMELNECFGDRGCECKSYSPVPASSSPFGCGCKQKNGGACTCIDECSGKCHASTTDWRTEFDEKFPWFGTNKEPPNLLKAFISRTILNEKKQVLTELLEKWPKEIEPKHWEEVDRIEAINEALRTTRTLIEAATKEV